MNMQFGNATWYPQKLTLNSQQNSSDLSHGDTSDISFGLHLFINSFPAMLYLGQFTVDPGLMLGTLERQQKCTQDSYSHFYLMVI